MASVREKIAAPDAPQRGQVSPPEMADTLILPDDVMKDKIVTRVEHGVLTVTLPKMEQEEVKLSRKIEIE